MKENELLPTFSGELATSESLLVRSENLRHNVNSVIEKGLPRLEELLKDSWGKRKLTKQLDVLTDKGPETCRKLAELKKLLSKPNRDIIVD